VDLDVFFSGQSLSRQLFDAVLAAIEATGPAEMRVSKSQITCRRRRGFTGEPAG
jgi:hypothetical protein